MLAFFSTGAFEGGHVFGSHISLGIVAGATMTPDFRSVTLSQTFAFTDSYSSRPGAFLLGPMVEVGIARKIYFEGEAIHQPMLSTSHFGFNGYLYPADTQSINSWTFPLLGKYKFSMHGMKAFVEAGASFRVGATQLTGSSGDGVTAGVGIETHVRRLAIAPSVRYTHWGRNSPVGPLWPFQNQVAVLTGFSL